MGPLLAPAALAASVLAALCASVRLDGARGSEPPNLAKSKQKLPNVLVMFIDDMGYGDLGCLGNKSVASPRIDQLADDGVLFTQWLSAESICTPSRGALMTGRLPVRLGLASNDFKARVLHPASEGGLPLSELTLAEALRERGYRTRITGKWHLGIGEGGQYLPTNHGFDGFYGMPITNVQTCREGKTVYRQNTLAEFVFDNTKTIWLSLAAGALGLRLLGLVGNRGFGQLLTLTLVAFALAIHITGTYTLLNRKNCLLYRDRDIVQQPIQLDNLTQRLTADAEAFIRASGAQPWFLYMSYVKMHTALFNMPEFGPISYLANIRELDWSVGRLLDTIEETGATDDTLIWLTSDNGPFKERFEEGGSSGPLRGAKTQTYEGGIRVPGIARFPQKFPSKTTTNEAVSTMDIFPTTLAIVDEAAGDVAGLTFTQPHGMLDGKNLLPYLRALAAGDDSAPKPTGPHDVMFHYCGLDLAAVRLEGRYKVFYTTPKWEEGFDSCPSSTACHCAGSRVTRHDPPLVFDLQQDLQEARPLDSADPRRERLIQQAAAAVAQHKASLESDRQPDQMHRMQLPWLMPCCDPPNCECDREADSVRGVGSFE